MKLEFEDAAVPLARFLGHSMAAAVGFCGLGAISLVPVLMLKLLLFLGMSELAVPMRALELTLLLADACLFGVVFLSGVAVFAAETVGVARRRIRAALSEDRRDQ